ncbi:phage tail protein [Helicobacter pullorum]|uniref:phage tail protein n=1 Tax=Helicobacter pullorum TaxID=35818 RepID=UPI003D9A0BDC
MAEKKEFYTLLTNVGIAKFIAARASGNGVNLKTFKLSSKIIVPSESMNTLEEVVYESLINSKYVDKENTHYVHLECVVPSSVGGFEINSIGIYDEAGDLLAVGNLPSTYKPLLEQGSAKELLIKVTMELKNASEVILELDPSVILASRDYVNEVKLELELKIDEAIANFTEELRKYALKNGSTSEVFNVANATEASHAINKGEFERALNLKADKTQIENINNSLSNYVKTTGNQSIAGNKTFSGTTTLNGTTNTKALNASGAITAKSTLAVTGDTTLNGNLAANGAVAFKNLPTCATQASSDNQFVNLATLKKQVPLLGGIGIEQYFALISKKEEHIRDFLKIKQAVIKLDTNVTYTNNTKKNLFVIGGAFESGRLMANMWVNYKGRFICNNQVIIESQSIGSGADYGGGYVVYPVLPCLIIPAGAEYKHEVNHDVGASGSLSIIVSI